MFTVPTAADLGPLLGWRQAGIRAKVADTLCEFVLN